MLPEAWTDPHTWEWVNAYNHVKPGDKVYKNGKLLGVASGVYTRCTATSPGSVQLENMWISGSVAKRPYGWELSEYIHQN
jgi:hypothetical protein